MRYERALGMPALREATFEDYDQIAQLQKRNNLLPIKSDEEWRHLWIDNPAYATFPDKLPIGWILETNQATVVGYLGTIPLWYELGERVILAAAGYSWVVDEGYRSLSPLLMEQYFSQPEIELLLIATVNSAAADCFSMFDAIRVPVGEWDRTSFWITNYRGFARSWLAKKNIPRAEFLCRFAEPMAFATALVHDPKLRRECRGVRAEACSRIDDRFDLFWNEQRRRRQHVLRSVRTTETLEWHYGHAVRKNRAWIFTVMERGCLAAYGVFYRHDNDVLGLTRMRLVDFQCVVDHPPFLASMLLKALETCREQNIICWRS